MSYTSQASLSQTMSGLISITDGVVMIEDGRITNCQYLDVEGDAKITGDLDVSGALTFDSMTALNLHVSNISNLTKTNTDNINASTVNASKVKASHTVSITSYSENITVKNLMLPSISAPSSSSDPGIEGQIKRDYDYLYIYGGSVWKRIPLQSF